MNIKEVNIPQTPGCYLFKNSKDQIIYVGKSKFLPKRVTSYFQKNHEDQKTQKLVLEIKAVDFISTESENESLVLEEDLIKLYKPKFNIKGKDSRSIKSRLVITDDTWSKLDVIHPQDELKGKVLLQFTSAAAAWEVYETLHDIFPLRSCSYNITEAAVELKKFHPCLEYQMERCGAPCAGLTKKFEYLNYLKLISDISLFNFSTTKKFIFKKMKFHSDRLEFEKAQNLKSKLEVVDKLQRQLNPLYLISKRDECLRIKQILGLTHTPLVIDAFDNSHTAGTEAVCGLVRFSNLLPDKSSYRKFIIKSGSGGDDYASFEEVLTRRFKRLVNEKINLPNLVIIDGARPQLNVAISVLTKLNLIERIDLISISKNSRHGAETIHLKSGKDIKVGDMFDLAKILDEVHRFALSFHKQRRSRIFKK